MIQELRIYRKAYGHTLKVAFVVIQQVASGLRGGLNISSECLSEKERDYLIKTQEELNKNADRLFKLGNHLGA